MHVVLVSVVLAVVRLFAAVAVVAAVVAVVAVVDAVVDVVPSSVTNLEEEEDNKSYNFNKLFSSSSSPFSSVLPLYSGNICIKFCSLVSSLYFLYFDK